MLQSDYAKMLSEHSSHTPGAGAAASLGRLRVRRVVIAIVRDEKVIHAHWKWMDNMASRWCYQTQIVGAGNEMEGVDEYVVVEEEVVTMPGEHGASVMES